MLLYRIITCNYAVDGGVYNHYFDAMVSECIEQSSESRMYSFIKSREINKRKKNMYVTSNVFILRQGVENHFWSGEKTYRKELSDILVTKGLAKEILGLSHKTKQTNKQKNFVVKDNATILLHSVLKLSKW